MKKVIAYFIKFPVAVNVALIAIFLFGIIGLSRMNSSFFPLFPTNTITISIAYPGASPEEIEEGIVLKIEDNLKGIIGIDRVTSASSENAAVITVETFEEYDINDMIQEVKNAVDRVPSFPVDMEPPIIAKRENLNEVVSLALSGDNVPLRTLKQIAYQVEDDIRGLEGISQVQITGFPGEEIEIAVRENDLRALDMTFAEVAQAVARANILTTGGNIKTSEEDYLIRANNRAYFGDELDHIVVRAQPDGRVIRLKDVAAVRDTWSENPDRMYYNGNPAIQIRVQTTNQEEYLGASDKMREYINKFNAQRENVQLNVTADRSISLRERTRILTENGMLGILLVLILLSVFLKPSLALWVAMGLPVSFLGMFILAPALITINVMSLFGMIVVIGILVDDGIVIGENIYAHYEKGKSATKAAVDGTLEVMPAVISAILTTVVAFSSFFFLEGRFGDFYYEVAVVVIVTLLFSLLEALVILPAHISHSRAMNKNKQGFLINRWADKFMYWIRDRLYAPALKFALANRLFALSIPLALLILTIGAVGGGVIGLSIFPAIASDRVSISLNMPEGTSEVITDSIARRIEAAAWVVNEQFSEKQEGDLPVIENIVRRIGPGTSRATLEINLLPGEQRSATSDEIANAIEAETGPVYGVENLVYGAGRNFGGQPISVSLTGNNIDQLKGAKTALKEALKENPRLKDITDNDPIGIKEIDVRLKDNAYLLGLTLNDVMAQVRAGFFGQSVQRFQRGRDEIRVWVRYDRAGRNSIKNLDDMWIVTPSRARVPLSEIATYSIARGDVTINHLNGRREIKVEADIKESGDDSAEILADLQNNIMPEILARYPTVSPLYEGQNREATKISRSFKSVLPVVFFLMYAIIAFTFRSYSQPLLLFLMIPFSLVGVAWGHWLHGYSMSMLSVLGVIALIGILVNDGLVLVSKFNGYLKEGLPFEEALYEAGRSRFRAIFLTTVTTVAGLGPLTFETARTAQFLIPMAITIAYGIAYATLLTLFLLPIMLYISNSLKLGRIWLFTGKRLSRREIERAVKEQHTEQEALKEVL
ncbi:MAG: efflux RND transporter permease subunit [Lewinellaceae bacterium]|nr:efflux RND transporter permease subunit [Lewinellaceae bacterium]